MNIIEILKLKFARRSSKSLIKYYKGKGISIGDNCVFRSPGTTTIDIMRPSLIKIGSNVDMNKNFTIMAHDFGHRVFLYKYGQFLSSSGRVTIGNNIYFGINVVILKNVTIGDNCIIGAGSIVTHDIPSNSVAVGVPCKVICSIDEYYAKRQKEYILEAIDYAKCIKEREHREPTVKDFIPEFSLYVDSHNIKNYDIKAIRSRLGSNFQNWIMTHKAVFNGFDDFLKHTM